VALVAALALSLTTIADKPNILFIFADDIGYEALECYGGLDFKTPELNRMAAEGMCFNRMYTSPVCTPSRVSMHTGLYVPRHGHYGVLPVHAGTKKIVNFKKLPTYAQQLRANGYLTSVTGKWQLATLEHHPNHIRDSGFDSWCIWQIWRQGKKTERHWGPIYNEDGEVRDDVAKRFGPDVLAEYVIEQMSEAKAANKPFMIVHNELLPHWPIVETPLDRAQKRKPDLYGMIFHMDKLVGQLLDAVEDLGIRDNTYVIFMGDNGTDPPYVKNPKAGQPGERKGTRHTTAGNVNGGKGDLNDAGSHVAFLVWGPPSVPKGQVCDDLVDVVDLFPTFCELSGTPLPGSLKIDGRSVAPQIHGKQGIKRDWVHHSYGRSDSVFDGRFRLTGKKLIDARKLPAESTAADGDAEAVAAKKRLAGILAKVTKDGPIPPEPFAER
jgi:arylsulfatase A-like enzyme